MQVKKLKKKEKDRKIPKYSRLKILRQNKHIILEIIF